MSERRTIRRYAHEMYPHAEEGETRALAVDVLPARNHRRRRHGRPCDARSPRRDLRPVPDPERPLERRNAMKPTTETTKTQTVPGDGVDADVLLAFLDPKEP